MPCTWPRSAHTIRSTWLSSGCDKIVLAGEPGGSIPHVRGRIAQLWDADVLDHGGATEVGPWGYGDAAARGMYVMESEFIAEFLSLETGAAAVEGELSELVLTNLGRIGCPVIRYRTGDLVRPIWQARGMPIDSCCWKAGLSAASTTCWWCGE